MHSECKPLGDSILRLRVNELEFRVELLEKAVNELAELIEAAVEHNRKQQARNGE